MDRPASVHASVLYQNGAKSTYELDNTPDERMDFLIKKYGARSSAMNRSGYPMHMDRQTSAADEGMGFFNTRSGSSDGMGMGPAPTGGSPDQESEAALGLFMRAPKGTERSLDAMDTKLIASSSALSSDDYYERLRKLDTEIAPEQRDGFFKNAYRAYKKGKTAYKDSKFESKQKKLEKLQRSVRNEAEKRDAAKARLGATMNPTEPDSTIASEPRMGWSYDEDPLDSSDGEPTETSSIERFPEDGIVSSIKKKYGKWKHGKAAKKATQRDGIMNDLDPDSKRLLRYLEDFGTGPEMQAETNEDYTQRMRKKLSDQSNDGVTRLASMGHAGHGRTIMPGGMSHQARAGMRNGHYVMGKGHAEHMPTSHAMNSARRMMTNDGGGLELVPATMPTRQLAYDEVWKKPSYDVADRYEDKMLSSSFSLFDSPVVLKSVSNSLRQVISIFRSPPLEMLHVNGSTWGDAASQTFHVLLDSDKILRVISNNARKGRGMGTSLGIQENSITRMNFDIRLNSMPVRVSRGTYTSFSTGDCQASTYAAMFDRSIPISEFESKGAIEIDVSNIMVPRDDEFQPRVVSSLFDVPSSSKLAAVVKDTAFVRLVTNTKTGKAAIWALHYDAKSRAIDGLMMIDNANC